MKLGKRKLKSGLISYYLDDYHDGQRIRESLNVTVPPGVDPLVAKNQKRLAEQLFQARQAEILLSRKGLLVDQEVLLAEYTLRLGAGRDRQDHVVRVLPYIRQFFGNASIRSIQYRDCNDFQSFLTNDALSPRTKKRLSAKTVWHYFGAFKYVLNEAVKDTYIPTSPASHVRKKRVPEKVVIALTAPELAVLWKTPMDSPDGDAVKRAFFFSVNTGLRIGDLKALTWGEIDQISDDDWRIKKAQDKSGIAITVPINKNAREILPDKRGERNEKVFPALSRTVNSVRYVPVWASKAGIEKPVTFHVARHTFGTLIALQGTNAIQIQKLMGHTTIKMTEHYTQSVSSESKELVESLPSQNSAIESEDEVDGRKK